RDLHSLPTRRSSDLGNRFRQIDSVIVPNQIEAITPLAARANRAAGFSYISKNTKIVLPIVEDAIHVYAGFLECRTKVRAQREKKDRKSTRLNSSHVK